MADAIWEDLLSDLEVDDHTERTIEDVILGPIPTGEHPEPDDLAVELFMPDTDGPVLISIGHAPTRTKVIVLVSDDSDGTVLHQMLDKSLTLVTEALGRFSDELERKNHDDRG